MKKYRLINRAKETINIVEVGSIEDAVQYFAKIKNLTIDMLLSVYRVVGE